MLEDMENESSNEVDFSVSETLQRNRTNNRESLYLTIPTRMRTSPNQEIFSPVTCLALNLHDLNTCGTPKRRLSLDSTGTPTPVRGPIRPSFRKLESRNLSTTSSDGGCCMDSPTPLDTPTREKRFEDFLSAHKDQNDNEPKHSSAFRRVQSLPNQEANSPCSFVSKSVDSKARTHFFVPDDDSQDSGVSGISDLKDRKDDDFQFVKPTYIPPRRSGSRSSSRPSSTESLSSPGCSPGCSPRSTYVHINEDTRSPYKYSPVKSSCRPISAPAGTMSFSLPGASPAKDDSPTLMTSSLTSSMDDDERDDGFLDLYDENEVDNMPTSMTGLVHGALLHERPTQPRDNKFKQGGRVLFRSPSMPGLGRSEDSFIRRRPSYKRPDPPRDQITPVQNKRRRSVLSASASFNVVNVSPEKERLIQRCHSANEELIKSALSKAHCEMDLVGDTTRPFCLPVIKGKHQDLKSITPDTISDLLQGGYEHQVEQFVIVDCRYPYEYNGGHIQGAKNIYKKDDIMKFLENPMKSNDPSKRHILIFHCEFSSERAPKLSRFLRNNDREANKECYPSLHYPELYLLDGGYKNFYETHKEWCVPQTYKPMLHSDHSSDLKHFRTKSKSWAGEKSRQPQRVGLKW